MKRASISTKMIVLLIFTSVMTLLINVMMFLNINQVLVQIEQVYATNVQLNKMTEELDKVHSEMLEYLKTRDSGVLQEYYISQQNLSEQLAMVQEETMDRQTSVLKNNIYYLGKNYLKISEEAVKAKRGRDVNTYGERYENAGKMKRMVHHNINIGYRKSIPDVSDSIHFITQSHISESDRCRDRLFQKAKQVLALFFLLFLADMHTGSIFSLRRMQNKRVVATLPADP